MLNQSRGVPASRLCETGRVFIEHNGQNFECAAVGVRRSPRTPARRWRRRAPADFYTAKHHVEALAAAAGIDLSRGSRSCPSPGPSTAGRRATRRPPARSARRAGSARFGLLNLAMAAGARRRGKGSMPGSSRSCRKNSRPAARGRATAISACSRPALARPRAGRRRLGARRRTVRARRWPRSPPGGRRRPSRWRTSRSSMFTRARACPRARRAWPSRSSSAPPTRTLTDDEVNAVLSQIQDEIAKTTSYQIQQIDAMSQARRPELDHVANLARIALTPEEKARFPRSWATCSPTSRS